MTQYTEEKIVELRKAIAVSYSFAEALRVLGLTVKNGNYITIKKYIKLYNISIKHFDNKPKKPGQRVSARQSWDTVLVENREYGNTSKLKRYLIEDRLLEFKCYSCGLTEWLGKPAPLELDHINGNRTDNRLENLRLLCPNCHALTATYCGKNKNKYKNKTIPQQKRYTKVKRKKYCIDCIKEINLRSLRCGNCDSIHREHLTKIEWPSSEELQKLVSETSYVAVGKCLGVSDRAVKKHLDRHPAKSV